MATRRKAKPTDPIFAEMREQQFATVEDVQHWLDARMKAYNEAAQPELAELSPVQVHRLVSTDWSDLSVTRLTKDLTLADVERSAWYQGGRALILAVDARGGILPSSAEEDGILEELDQELRAATSGLGLERVPVISGQPVGVGHVLHEVMALALACGHLRGRKERLVATKRAVALTKERAAGQLYVELFRSYTREVDVLGLYEMPDVLGELLTTLPFILYRVQAETAHWRSADWLAKRAVLPDTRSRFRELDALPVEARTAPMSMLVLQPLVQLGLLEGRARPPARVADFRRTPLFTRLLRFDWSTAEPQTAV